MRNSLRRWLIYAITAGAFASVMTSAPAGRTLAGESLDALFARYDRESDGPAKEQLAAQIDALSHQKYATVSRLYWHVDLASARAAARVQGRPILHLRMLGRLDEDLSCANSRLFRATLYANEDVSRFLRDRFVLYWSSERPVPRLTIDYGDGRRLERTITGNSAHYVLDENGEVLDVLPGLYAPRAFRRELERSLEFAVRVRDKSPDERARMIAAHHQQHVATAERNWLGLAPQIPAVQQLLIRTGKQTVLVAAQRAALTKAGVELRDIRAFARELAPETLADGEIDAWSTLGQRLYGLSPLVAPNVESAMPPASLLVLDDASRDLVARLHNSGPAELRANGEDLQAMIARLERTIAADTALNQLRLRPQISREIVRRAGRVAFAPLNAWIYDQVFRTPGEDAWLGLLQRDVFTGVPGDGVVLGSGKR